ncbi:MAG: Rrf2 family transcriptional regulator [Balneolaceae bacterium]|nr:Rrf2 family transcriptional regulator [Balneolaceae bacterium]
MRLISQGAQYAISAIIAISKHTGDGAVSASDLSKSLDCPAAYLSQILAKLKEPGILHSRRGLNGGVYLAKPIAQISMMDVIAAIDGTEFFDKCFMGINGCGHIEPCPFHEFWSVERKKIEQWLRSTTFESIDKNMTQAWFELRLQFSNGVPSFRQ